MEAFREYLRTIPRLADRLMTRLADALEEGTFDHNNADELRLAYKEAQQVALEKIEEEKTPYYGIVYAQVLWKCPACGEETQGAYWEISNPLTKERGMFRVRLIHELLVHGNDDYSEPIVNLSEVQMGFDEHTWDAKKMLKVLDGLPVPPAAIQELQALAAKQAQQVAPWAVGKGA